MSGDADTDRAPIRVVLGDANVLYSRVLRDYLVYAADGEIISIRWSAEILGEVVEHLIANRPEFDTAAGARLVTLLNAAYPEAQVEVDSTAADRVAGLTLPDEDDRHVLAAAVAAEADILCTDNIKDFPADALREVGIQGLTADALLSLLVTEFGEEMLAVHRRTVSTIRGATDESTLVVLRRAGATTTADLVEALLRS